MITKKQYSLGPKAYVSAVSLKTNIVLHGSFSRTKYSYNSVQSAETCLMDKWNTTADACGGHYVIGRDGTIYSCIDPLYWSSHVGAGKYFQQVNRRTIAVFLVNELFLEKSNSQYYAFGFKDLHSSLYKGKVFESSFKGYTYWADYDEAQIQSLAQLLKELSREHSIPLTMLGKSAGYMQDADLKAGIVSGSNLNKSSYSLPLPSWAISSLEMEGIQILR